MLEICHDVLIIKQAQLHSLIKRREQLILFRNQEIARLDKEISLDVEQSL